MCFQGYINVVDAYHVQHGAVRVDARDLFKEVWHHVT